MALVAPVPQAAAPTLLECHRPLGIIPGGLRAAVARKGFPSLQSPAAPSSSSSLPAGGLLPGAALALAVGASRHSRRQRKRGEAIPRQPRHKFQDILYENIYRPLREEDFEDEQEEKKEGDKKYRAGWRQANMDAKKERGYGKQWKWIDERGKRGWKQGKRIDVSEELEANAAKLRTMYKRPRFGWKEVHKDQLETAKLDESLPAIGMREVWLSKYLSHCGVCSRRKVSELVLAGRVTVNGNVVQDLVQKVDPKKDEIYVDGKKQGLITLGEIVWIMLHKPKGVIVTMEDPLGRRNVMDYVPFAKDRRLVPLGRIDRNASGLVLLTNDYEWHTILSHPRYEHAKKYRVEIWNGVPDREKLQAMANGLHLPDEERPLLPLEDFEVLTNNTKDAVATVRFAMKQGRYRQIRRMFEWIGHPVKNIKRVGFGLLRLDGLKLGEWKVLTPKDVRRLKGQTILKRPRKHPMDEAKALENAEEVAEGATDEVSPDLQDLLEQADNDPWIKAKSTERQAEQGRRERGAEREKHLRRMGVGSERGESAENFEINESEWDDAGAGTATSKVYQSEGRRDEAQAEYEEEEQGGSRRKDRPLRNVSRFGAEQNKVPEPEPFDETADIKSRVMESQRNTGMWQGKREQAREVAEREQEQWDGYEEEDWGAKYAGRADEEDDEEPDFRGDSGKGFEGGRSSQPRSQSRMREEDEGPGFGGGGGSGFGGGMPFQARTFDQSEMGEEDEGPGFGGGGGSGFGGGMPFQARTLDQSEMGEEWDDFDAEDMPAAPPGARAASMQDLGRLQGMFNQQMDTREPSAPSSRSGGFEREDAPGSWPSQGFEDAADSRPSKPAARKAAPRPERPPPAPAPAFKAPQDLSDLAALKSRFESLAKGKRGPKPMETPVQDPEEREAMLEAMQQRFDERAPLPPRE